VSWYSNLTLQSPISNRSSRRLKQLPSRIRKPKPKPYRRPRRLQHINTFRYIFIACTYTTRPRRVRKGQGHNAKPLKIHAAPYRPSRTFGLAGTRCSIPTQFRFFHHRPGRLPSDRAEINILGRSESAGRKVADERNASAKVPDLIAERSDGIIIKVQRDRRKSMKTSR
jgi:hypothetical protein